MQCLSTRKQKRLFSSSRASLQPSAMNNCMSICRLVNVSRYWQKTINIIISGNSCSINNNKVSLKWIEILWFVFGHSLSYLPSHMVCCYLVPFTADLYTNTINNMKGAGFLSEYPNLSLAGGRYHWTRVYSIDILGCNECLVKRTEQQGEEGTGHSRFTEGMSYLHSQPGIIKRSQSY